jgi:hypothetical protein
MLTRRTATGIRSVDSSDDSRRSSPVEARRSTDAFVEGIG